MVGQPWMIGGYPGSYNLAKFILDLVPCDILTWSWILVEPDGPRSISTTILNHYGLKIPDDFDEVGRFLTPAWSGGYRIPREQILYKPVVGPRESFICKATTHD